MADVVICYARDDEARVSPLASAIAEKGYRVQPIRDDDDGAALIDAACAVLIIWSERAVASRRVRAEAGRAREQGKLVQAALDESRAPLPFNLIHSAALGGWSGDADHLHWRKLLESLEGLCAIGDHDG